MSPTELKATLLELTQIARDLDRRGKPRQAEAVDEFVRVAYFENMKKFQDRPEAAYFGGVNPGYTGNNEGMATWWHQLSTPCGAISLPPCSIGGSDPEECAQMILDHIYEQCPQLRSNEQAMTQYFQDLVDWATNDYAEQKQNGTPAAPQPNLQDYQAS